MCSLFLSKVGQHLPNVINISLCLSLTLESWIVTHKEKEDIFDPYYSAFVHTRTLSSQNQDET